MIQRWTFVALRRENERQFSTFVDLCLENASVNRAPEWRMEGGAGVEGGTLVFLGTKPAFFAACLVTTDCEEN
jgi:hypothetical protein